MGYYKDLREYIQALESNNLLWRIKSQVKRETELIPVVRWQFRGLPETERKAFLFDNVVDVKGKKYNGPVLVAAHAANREVYALAMMCKPDEITKRWEQAQLKPIEPKLVKTGPVQEEVHMGDSLLEHGGLDEFPIPISTPGYDNAPYFSAGNWISKDPETGIRNVGNYRGMVKSQTMVGTECYLPQHMRVHREMYRKKGIPKMPAAIVIGPTPNVGLVSVTKIPYGTDELAVAGGIAGEPVKVVKGKTVDIEVPAAAEIVIEGGISTEYLEREGPFGEYTGFMGMGRPTIFLDVTCITHRKRPIWNAFISQMPPSESSTLRKFGYPGAYYKHLKRDLGIAAVQEVAFHDMSGNTKFCVIKLKGAKTSQVWQALYGVANRTTTEAKFIIAVDDDIDINDMDSVIWAISFRVEPHRDVRIMPPYKLAILDPSAAPPDELEKMIVPPLFSVLLIDATTKWDFPPVSLPKREYMERAREIWEKEGLPALTPRVPWHGYSLGYWPKEAEEEAELALKGEHYQTGEKLAKKERIKG